MPPVPRIPHPEHPRLVAALRRLVADGRTRRWRGCGYRAVAQRWSGRQALLSGEGGRVHGSRWLAPGVARVLHLAGTPELALAEALARHRRANIPEWQAMPLVLRGVRVDARRGLDLTDGALRRALGVSAGRMTAPGWEDAAARGEETIAQAVGRAALEAGVEALVVPSAVAGDGVNLVVFPDVLPRAGRLEILPEEA